MKATQELHDLGQSSLIPADGGDCEEVLAEFAAAGIDIDALAARLQKDGAASFAKSWSELMTVIEAKSAALQRVR
jgi:transaldolase